ncbi:hypothetical protein OESDEN_03435 [Oesophagostomum dentatum]|uniref:Uncharacterized protein n=1 Tax=Oesophagostomum dentatum TaxID=61180 RepID=A0A0B1TLB3_OESDE|nr:hypothetical protein OESDEN_03435 [Oesophagostomum dentatum]
MMTIEGTSKKTCERKTDFCYNVTADLTQYNELTMAGCSTYRCMNLTTVEKVKERVKDWLKVLGQWVR